MVKAIGDSLSEHPRAAKPRREILGREPIPDVIRQERPEIVAFSQRDGFDDLGQDSIHDRKTRPTASRDADLVHLDAEEIDPQVRMGK